MVGRIIKYAFFLIIIFLSLYAAIHFTRYVINRFEVYQYGYVRTSVESYSINDPGDEPVVNVVRIGFPAWEAGIRSGDRILQVNDTAIHTVYDIRGPVLGNDTVTVTWLRGEDTLTATMPTRWDRSIYDADDGRRVIGFGYHMYITVFTNVDSSEFVDGPIPAIGDTLIEVNQQRTPWYLGNEFTDLMFQPIPPGVQHTLVFTHHGDTLHTTIETQRRSSVQYGGETISNLLLYFITALTLWLGVWLLQKRGNQEVFRVLAFYYLTFSATFLYLAPKNLFNPAFTIPSEEILRSAIGGIMVFVGGAWLHLVLMYPRPGVLMTRFRWLGYSICYSLNVIYILSIFLTRTGQFPDIIARFGYPGFLVLFFVQWLIGFIILAVNYYNTEIALERRQLRLILWNAGIFPTIILVLIIAVRFIKVFGLV